MAIEGKRGRLREWMEGESMFGRTHPRPFRSEMDGLRGASERDDGQMPSADDEGHTPPLELPGLVEIGSREYAGQVPETPSLAGRMGFSGATGGEHAAVESNNTGPD